MRQIYNKSLIFRVSPDCFQIVLVFFWRTGLVCGHWWCLATRWPGVTGLIAALWIGPEWQSSSWPLRTPWFVTFENSGPEYSGVVESPKSSKIPEESWKNASVVWTVQHSQNLLQRLAREEVVVVLSSSVSKCATQVFSIQPCTVK